MKAIHLASVTALVLSAAIHAGDIRTTASSPAGARVCVINIASAEQSCDGESPVKLQVMKFAADNIDNRRRESLLSSALSAYVAQGFRIVSCLEQAKDAICIVAKDSK